ncbi:hypothetical protein LUZ62_035714 [Rhynchospora pubera]|uniref:Uncharacterized protein n=1 Tax=Rhynchospora pubera TaxID=906938 RepID=A0AAV8ETG7_9POAL|nr:hypothetical protein LUZ62_035714 [Rhynchospora pubera]
MSRCFPYPPPYFGEAEIESIKKEKERLEEEAKRERKREKKEKRKKEKKEKRSGQDHELSKEIKKSLKRKYEELGLVEPKDKHDSQHHHKSKKPRDEQLETSGLTEEHGQPSAVRPANFESPNRSQDSSKRNSSSMPSPTPSLTNSGSTIRIKLQSRSRDSLPKSQTSQLKVPVSVLQLTKSREVVPTPQTTKSRERVSAPLASKVEEEFPFLHASKSKTASVLQKPRAVSQTLKPREPVLQTPRLKEPVLESLVPRPREVPVPPAPKVLPKANGATGLSKQHIKSEAGLVQSSSFIRQSVSKEPLLKKEIEPRAQTQIPEKDASQKPKLRGVGVPPAQQVKPKRRDIKAEPVPASKPTPVVQQVQALNTKQRVADGPPLVSKQDMKPIASGMPPVSVDEPCFSGRKLELGERERRESKHHHHSSSKRSKRKEAEKLFEELITNWRPPMVDLLEGDVGDQDWLMSGSKKRRVETLEGDDDWLSKSSKNKTGEEGLLGHTNGVTCSYQTWAVPMPELDIYQLPYVVPF